MKLFLKLIIAAVVVNIYEAADNCAVNRNDREFCNTFHAVCLSQRDKSCLAKSLKTCLPQVDLPRTTLTSWVDYVDKYLMAIFTPVPTTESPIIRTGNDVEIKIEFNTGVEFIDHILSYLVYFKDTRIRDSVLKHTQNQNLLGNHVTIQDVDIIVKKVEYVFTNFSTYRLNFEKLRQWLVYLRKNKTQYYRLFSAVMDGLLTDLGIVATVTKETNLPQGVIIDWYVVLEPSSYNTVSYTFCHGDVKEQKDTCERYCTDSYGSNWILMQARERVNEISAPFDKNLYRYAEGFGNTELGYWMGLGCLHSITKNQQHELLIELTNSNGQIAIAHYDSFSVGPAITGYQLNLGR